MNKMAPELEFYKKQFFRGPKIHMNNAGLSPIPQAALEKIKYWAQRFYQEGYYTDHDYQADVVEARKSLARVINCEHTEIAYFQATSGGISQIAFGFGLKPGDEVVIWDQEYPSNMYPWQAACARAQGKLVMVPSLPHLATPIEGLLKACTARTKIIATSWVQYQTGARADIESLARECKKRGIFLFVDVIQGMGLHAFDFKGWGVDAVAGGSHKWLTGPVGVGYLALKQEHQARFTPTNIGSGTYGSCDDPADLECIPKTDASRFESGSRQVLEITALGAACELILQTGVVVIEKEAVRLGKKLRAGLEDLGLQIHSPYALAEHATPMVNFTHPDLKRVKKIFADNGIDVVVRGPGIRLSTHAFNSDGDVEAVIRLLKEKL